MKFKSLSFSTAIIAVLGFGSFAFAQDGSIQNVPQIERQQRGFGRHHGGSKLHGLSRLNLTEAQQQQIRTIFENFKNSKSAEREELRQLFSQRRSGGQLTAEQETRAKELREQMRAAKQQINNEILAVLTPEQRAQYETFRAEREANRNSFGGGGRGRGGFGLRGFRGFGSLNLTEAQQQQLRALNETILNSTQSQREELRQLYQQRRSGGQITAEQQNRVNELRQQLRQAGEQMRANLQSILTPEQRQQLEQRRAEFQQRMQERRQMRQNSDTQPQQN